MNTNAITPTIATIDETIPTSTPTITKNGEINIVESSIKKIEGNSGTTTFEFTLERSGNTDRTATVDYSVSSSSSFEDHSVDPIESSDFENNSFPSGRVKFEVGKTTQKIQIVVSTDEVYEANEYFSLNLLKARNATLGEKNSAIGIVENDDKAIISLDPITQLISEGSGDKPNAVNFNVTISNYELPNYSSDLDESQYPSVDYKVIAFGNNPVDQSDFIDNKLPSGTLVFNNNYDIIYKSYNYYEQPEKNTYSKNITLQINADHQLEANESFKLELSNPTHADFADEDSNINMSTIQNDDEIQNVAFVDFKTTYFEANEGQVQTFILERSQYKDSEVSVSYQIFKAGNADQKDFDQTLSGTVTFAKGETTKEINIKIAQDDLDESNEHYKLFLEANGDNVDVANTIAEGVIRNDDLGYNPNYHIDGTDGFDIIHGANGHDLIQGSNGNDALYGETGRDTLNGGSGEDSLFGGSDKDLLNGDEGNDSLYGQSGNDKLNGGNGEDALFGGTSNDTLSGGYQNDVLYGEDGNDYLSGNQGIDTLFGGAGNDTFSFYSDDNQENFTYAMTSSYLYQDDLPIDDLQDLSKGDKVFYNDHQIKQANYNPEPKLNQYVIAINQGQVKFIPPTEKTATSNVDIKDIPNLQPAFEPIKPDLSMLEDVVAVLDAQINTAGQFAVFSLDTETYLYIDGGTITPPIYYPTYYDKVMSSAGAVYDDGSMSATEIDMVNPEDTGEEVDPSTDSTTTTKGHQSIFGYSPEIQQDQSIATSPQKLTSLDSNFYGDVLVHIIGLTPQQVVDILG